MNVDTIITLSNNSKYLLLDKTSIEDKNYFYAIGVKDDLETVTREYIFIEEIQRDGKTFIKKVEDKETKEFLLTVFTNNYIDYAEKIENGEEKF